MAGQMPEAHIYPLSRLVHARPQSWEKALKDIEEGKRHAFGYYQPMREAVVQLTSLRGQRRDHIFDELVARAQIQQGRNSTSRLRDNTKAFESFEHDFYPRIARFRRSFLRQDQPGFEFEGLTLLGAPHFEALDASGRKRHVFLHAAKWSEPDLDAYLEFLGIVVEECYGGDSSTIWIMDLRAGKDIRWRSSARMRRRCRDTARLYGRLVKTIQTAEA